MDFLVEFEINVPEGAPVAEVRAREDAESSAAAKLVDQGHLVRLWTRHVAPGESRPVGLYRAGSEAEMDGLLRALPLYEWMRVTVTPLGPHPNDPALQARRRDEEGESSYVPEPHLTRVYGLEATLAPPLELGETAQGHRRIVPLKGGTFSGPQMSGRLLPGPAPIGRSSSRTAPRSATSGTPFRRTAGISSMSGHAVSVTAPRRCSSA
jgi:muconolactone delta-isomerase